MTEKPAHKKTKNELLQQLFLSFTTGVRSFRSIKARKWLEEKAIDFNQLEVGFSSGQFSHRKSEEFKQKYIDIGVLIPSKAAVRLPHLKAYSCFAPVSIVFPLKDEQGAICNLYGISMRVRKGKTAFLNEEGLYPGYPSVMTKRLYITSNVLDSASLLQSKVMENRDAVLSLFDGELKEQHMQAIANLKYLEEIIFIKQTTNE